MQMKTRSVVVRTCELCTWIRM